MRTAAAAGAPLSGLAAAAALVKKMTETDGKRQDPASVKIDVHGHDGALEPR